MSRGYIAIGIYGVKTPENLGTLWRSADLLGASLIFTVGARYSTQATDTSKARQSIPLVHFDSLEQMRKAKDPSVPLIAVELDENSYSLINFVHPNSAWYLLGAEDTGLPKKALEFSSQIIQIPAVKDFSFNVATAGSIVLYDRFVKGQK